jgi:hypothetical protein
MGGTQIEVEIIEPDLQKAPDLLLRQHLDSAKRTLRERENQAVKTSN